MYSTSEPSQSKWEQFKGGIESDVMNIKNPTPLADLYNELEAKYDNPQNDNPDLTIDFNNSGIVVSLGSASLFESGAAKLKPEGRRIIKILSRELRRRLKKYDLVIDVEGHTDDIPIETAQIKLDIAAAQEVLADFKIKATVTDTYDGEQLMVFEKDYQKAMRVLGEPIEGS